MKVFDFFHSQESLTVLQWVLRSVVGFVFLLIAAKMMGQRSISQLRFLDFIIALTLGNIIAHPLSDEHLGLKGSMITTASLVFLYTAAVWLSLKIPLFKQLFDPHAIPLIKEGKLNYRNLKQAKLSIEFLYSELRKQNVEDITKVAYSAWEPGGNLSVFIHPAEGPATRKDLDVPVTPFNLTRPIITDGHIHHKMLHEIGRDTAWLKEQIQPYTLNIVILATIDSKHTLQVHAVREVSGK
ncbi:DUF421 domain-containing protein [Paenibacillus sp. CN-4]|uniref:DUF421 domain-containing protein n=1 Tax=Paenibacillus nanchangensis TaxID=3348343 RepID=UPI0039797972